MVARTTRLPAIRCLHHSIYPTTAAEPGASLMRHLPAEQTRVKFAGLRVAALMDTAIVSGPGRQLVALAQGLREYGVTLRVYMFQRAGRPRSPFISYLDRAGIEHIVLPDRGPLD